MRSIYRERMTYRTTPLDSMLTEHHKDPWSGSKYALKGVLMFSSSPGVEHGDGNKEKSDKAERRGKASYCSSVVSIVPPEQW